MALGGLTAKPAIDMGLGLGFEPFSFPSIAIIIGEVAKVCGSSHLS